MINPGEFPLTLVRYRKFVNKERTISEIDNALDVDPKAFAARVSSFDDVLECRPKVVDADPLSFFRFIEEIWSIRSSDNNLKHFYDLGLEKYHPFQKYADVPIAARPRLLEVFRHGARRSVIATRECGNAICFALSYLKPRMWSQYAGKGLFL